MEIEGWSLTICVFTQILRGFSHTLRFETQRCRLFFVDAKTEPEMGQHYSLQDLSLPRKVAIRGKGSEYSARELTVRSKLSGI